MLFEHPANTNNDQIECLNIHSDRSLIVDSPNSKTINKTVLGVHSSTFRVRAF